MNFNKYLLKQHYVLYVVTDLLYLKNIWKLLLSWMGRHVDSWKVGHDRLWMEAMFNVHLFTN
jgi:hypothetical protein